MTLPNFERKPLYAPRGAVATSQPLAAAAGLAVLRSGGNTVDAAIAAAVTLTVVQPASNQVGSDLFALVWDGERLHGLNGSGRAPAALTAARVRRGGHRTMPQRGWLPVTVPGAPRAWRDLHERFGRLPFEDLFGDAIEYADRGFPVSPTAAHYWQAGISASTALSGPEFEGFLPMYAPGGHAPAAGQTWRSADLAETLRRIAATGSEDLYSGKTAEQITAFAAHTGGLLSDADLAEHTSTWVAPITASYRGYEVWELPPNGQGLAALVALNILGGFDMPAYESAERYHLQIEATKLALADAHRYIADPDHAAVPIAGLLAPDYARRRRALIGPRALVPEPGEPDRGGTVYLCAADSDGAMVSLIQSNYLGFGAHVVVPGTGVSLQCRGAGFSLDDAHPGCLAPGKRPYHTIIPGFLARDGMPVGPFGIMGGHMQPQGHVQLISNTVDYGMDAQAALDAPRWYWAQGRRVHVEPRVPAAVRAALGERGHEITTDGAVDLVGCGQAIWRQAGGYVAGTEARADGCAIGY
ncbi:MAG TPA: gamma-glutamyltransferase family protein [Streptosporangiaceae bacterium]|nr:gamma-glutamyltransferase family protein [Streptosporangiaceae bacterium]